MRVRRLIVPLTVVFTISSCEEHGCEDGGPDLPRYAITGTVRVNGAPAPGITVSAGSGESDVTPANGRYTVRATFVTTLSASGPGVVFLDNDKTITPPTTADVDFEGFTTAAIRGRVLFGSTPLAGTTVVLSGPRSVTTRSDASGMYEFLDLPPTATLTNYWLSVTDGPPGVLFPPITSVALRGSDVVRDIVGTAISAGTVQGTVRWNGTGLSGVTVTVAGAGLTVVDTTDPNGRYSTGMLPQGDYTVTISGYDTNAYPFATTSRTATVTSGSVQADFDGAPNQPPVAAIISPETGAVFAPGSTAQFRGVANDPEDGTLTEASLVWTASSLAGVLGTGETMVVSLPIGYTTVTLTATDSSGATATSSVQVYVYDPSERP